MTTGIGTNIDERKKVNNDLKELMGEAKYQQWLSEHMPHLNNLYKQNMDAMLMQEIIFHEISDKLFLERIVATANERRMFDARILEKMNLEKIKLDKIFQSEAIHLKKPDEFVRLEKETALKNLSSHIDERLKSISNQISNIDNVLESAKQTKKEVDVKTNESLDLLFASSQKIIDSHRTLDSDLKTELSQRVSNLNTNRHEIKLDDLHGLHQVIKAFISDQKNVHKNTRADSHLEIIGKHFLTAGDLLIKSKQISILTKELEHDKVELQREFQQYKSLQGIVKKELDNLTNNFKLPIIPPDSLSASNKTIYNVSKECDGIKASLLQLNSKDLHLFLGSEQKNNNDLHTSPTFRRK